jgi:hypothetical protein
MRFNGHIISVLHLAKNLAHLGISQPNVWDPNALGRQPYCKVEFASADFTMRNSGNLSTRKKVIKLHQSSETSSGSTISMGPVSCFNNFNIPKLPQAAATSYLSSISVWKLGERDFTNAVLWLLFSAIGSKPFSLFVLKVHGGKNSNETEMQERTGEGRDLQRWSHLARDQARLRTIQCRRRLELRQCSSTWQPTV